MREITNDAITAAIDRLTRRARSVLPPELAILMECAFEGEPNPAAAALEGLIAEFKRAAETGAPLLADSVVTVFADIGRDAAAADGAFGGAILARDKPGGQITLKVCVEDARCGALFTRSVFASEKELKEVERFVVSAVTGSGAGALAPVLVGVGLGGTEERAAELSKRALFRPVDTENRDALYAKAERRILSRLNQAGLGGYHGNRPVISVNLEALPSGAGGLHCAVAVGSHATSYAEITL
jgi:fumarate hydratase subunit alpha